MAAQVQFQQLKLQFVDPVQHDYEVIRPIVLFSETVTERSQEVDLPRTTVGDKARRFVQEGMLGLADKRTTGTNTTTTFPQRVAEHIHYLKQIYPPIHYREIVRILKRKFGYHTSHHRVKRFLEKHPVAVQLPLDFPTFHDFEDAYRARWTVVRMFYEGWNKKSIAECLQLSRTHVYQLLAAFEQDGFAGLEDKRTRPPDHPHNQLTLPFLKEVLDLQHAHPRAGRFRIHGLLDEEEESELPSERTVGRAMALNRQYHDAPGPWSTHQVESPDGVIKHLPYRPQFRHHLWFIDIRYLVPLDGEWVYSVCLIEGYSRKILAGMASPYQDLIAVLQILRAALAEYGCPAALVSDNGQVFKAHDYQRILRALNIQPLPIERGKPWQNLIEAQLKIQLRLADYNFEQASTLQEVQDYHAEFVETFNRTPHWAHREREDGRVTPEAVLEWVRGRAIEPELLDRLFRHLQLTRTVNRFGFVSVQRFYIYAEQGLARQRVSVWIYEGRLHIEYQHALLAEYAYKYDRRRKRLRSVSRPTLYATEFASPQLEFWELDDEQWLKVRPRPYHRRRQFAMPEVEQLPLLRLASLLILLAPPFVG